MSSGPVQDSPVQTKLAVGNGKNIMFYVSACKNVSVACNLLGICSFSERQFTLRNNLMWTCYLRFVLCERTGREETSYFRNFMIFILKLQSNLTRLYCFFVN